MVLLILELHDGPQGFQDPRTGPASLADGGVSPVSLASAKFRWVAEQPEKRQLASQRSLAELSEGMSGPLGRR